MKLFPLIGSHTKRHKACLANTLSSLKSLYVQIVTDRSGVWIVYLTWSNAWYCEIFWVDVVNDPIQSPSMFWLVNEWKNKYRYLNRGSTFIIQIFLTTFVLSVFYHWVEPIYYIFLQNWSCTSFFLPPDAYTLTTILDV